jgi:hypothetical protein
VEGTVVGEGKDRAGHEGRDRGRDEDEDRYRDEGIPSNVFEYVNK